MNSQSDSCRGGGRRRRTGTASFLTRAAAVACAVVVLTAVPAAGRAGATGGASWAVVTAPGTGGDDVLLGSTCADTVTCWAVGISISDITSNASYAPLVQRWDGSTWSLQRTATIPDSDGGGLFDVTCVTTSDCWAVGAVLGVAGDGNPTGTLTEHWDGTGWSHVPSPTPAGTVGGILQSVSCASSSDCWAVGYGTDANGGALHAVAERWNGASWTIVAGPDTGQAYDQLDSVTCVASDCWAVGSAGAAQQNPNFLPIFPAAIGNQGLVERWDGASWSVVPSVAAPAPDGGYLSSVTCTSAIECWASGSVTDADGIAGSTLMERWDGTGWSQVATPDADASAGNILGSVTCMAPDRCWAVGSFGSFGGDGGAGFQPQGFVESWDGGTWAIDSSPTVGALGFLDSVSCAQSLACWAVGSASVQPSQNDPGLRSLIEQTTLPPSQSQGLLLASRDGGAFALGDATFFGSMSGRPLARPIVGIVATPDRQGYWQVAADGGVFAFGDAGFYGSMSGARLDQPIVGIASTPDGRGYWEVAADGGVFAFGDADYAGSLGSVHLNQPIVGIASTPDGRGYWEVAADGGVFAFGDAPFLGSTGGTALNQPVTGLAGTPDGRGYWLLAADGGVFAFGDAPFLGSVPGQGLPASPPLVGFGPTPSGDGYWLVDAAGTVFSYGDAELLPSSGGFQLTAPIAGASSGS